MRRAGTSVGALLAAAALIAGGTVVLAQDPTAAPGEVEGATMAAVIREGSCTSPGDVAALLEDVGRPGSTDAGPDEAAGEAGDAASPVRTSITEVAMPLTEIVEGEHVLVLEGVESGQALACGDIAGPIVDDGLAIALASVDEGEVGGIGWLLGIGLEATRVHVFVASGDDTPPAQPGDEPDEPDEPSPSPSPDAGDGDQPDPEPDPIPDPDIDPGDDIDVDV